MNYTVINECTLLSDEEKISFPQVVHRLSEAGVDLYYADILASNKTFYAQNNAYTIACTIHAKKEVANDFNSEKIISAIRESQAGKIKYQEFIKKIMDAGVISYLVFLKGRQVVYLGRKGEQHIEHFPT